MDGRDVERVRPLPGAARRRAGSARAADGWGPIAIRNGGFALSVVCSNECDGMGSVVAASLVVDPSERSPRKRAAQDQPLGTALCR